MLYFSIFVLIKCKNMIKLCYIVFMGDVMSNLEKRKEDKLNKTKTSAITNFIKDNKNQIDKVKEFLLDQVVEIVKVAKENNVDIGDNLRVVIPTDCKDEVKDGILKFMISKEGEILPNIVDDKNKIIRKIRLKDVSKDTKKDLEGISVKKRLDLIQEQLEYMTELLEGIQVDIKNNRYGSIEGGISTYKQSLLETDELRKKDLQTNVQVQINNAIGQMQKSLYEGINYFKAWENVDGIEKFIKGIKYNSLSINNKLKYLCLDYYYINKGISTMLEMKLSQGMNDNEIPEFLGTYDDITRVICDANIKSWLPPVNDKNNWQRELIMNCEKDKGYVVIDYDIKTLLETGEN